MSKATKRKHVTKEVLDDFVLPEGSQLIVKVTAGRGNNLHEVETPNGERYLVSMPTKFRRNVWIKRGDFVLIDPIEEGDKVKAEINHILYPEQIKYIKQEGLWPSTFSGGQREDTDQMIPSDMLPPSEEDSDSDSGQEGFLVANPNRPQVCFEDTEDSTSEEEDELNSR